MTPESIQKLQQLEVLSEPYEALLYDVDGTLADNIHAHKAAYVRTAALYGIDLDPDLIDETAGWPTIAVAAEINKRYHSQVDVQHFAQQKSTIFINSYIQHTQPIDYVLAHLLSNVGRKKIGIVSGGSRSTLTITLSVIGVAEKYQTLVCAGDTPLGKPSPQPFLLAAEHLQVDPRRCLVFEDGDPGVQGAIAAGMGWVRIDQL